MANIPPKVGVVGYGGAFNMGRQHLNEMRNSGMIPTAVADLDAERLVVAQKEFPGIQTYLSLEEMLEKGDIDLVTIITPHNTHFELARQCLQAGRHAICEKPMTITMKEADTLIEEAKKRNLLVSIYHNRHWDGCVIRAVEAMRAGEIGEIVRVESHIGGYNKPGDWWRSSRTISGGILYDWGVHILEYCLQILGDEEMTEVAGYAKHGFWASHTIYGEDTNEDEGFLTVRFKSGKWLTLSVSSIDMSPKEQERGMAEITGTLGTYTMWGDRWRIKTLKDGETLIREGRNPDSKGHEFYHNVAAYLAGTDDMIITPEWARRPVQILDFAVQSAKAGHAIPAVYP
jgi:predicted dehydrogenase